MCYIQKKRIGMMLKDTGGFLNQKFCPLGGMLEIQPIERA